MFTAITCVLGFYLGENLWPFPWLCTGFLWVICVTFQLLIVMKRLPSGPGDDS